MRKCVLLPSSRSTSSRGYDARRVRRSNASRAARMACQLPCSQATSARTGLMNALPSAVNSYSTRGGIRVMARVGSPTAGEGLGNVNRCGIGDIVAFTDPVGLQVQRPRRRNPPSRARTRKPRSTSNWSAHSPTSRRRCHNRIACAGVSFKSGISMYSTWMRFRVSMSTASRSHLLERSHRCRSRRQRRRNDVADA